MIAEVNGERLLIFPETCTEQAAMIAFCAMYKKNSGKKPPVLTMPCLVKSIEDTHGCVAGHDVVDTAPRLEQ